MFIDTHSHLTMMPKDGIEEIKDLGVVTASTTLSDSIESIKIAKDFKNVFATVGIHPCDASDNWKKDFLEIKKLVEKKKENKIVGIGETGLDFYHKPFDKQRQVDVFIAHIKCAIENNLPIVVHIRDSAQEVLSVLEKYKNKVTGVAHCFSQKKDVADILLGYGFYLGIGGPITYPKNDSLRELFKAVPLERILLETDAPFLPPQPFRGKKNHPKYLPIIAQKIAEIKNIDVSVVENVTTENAKKLFLFDSDFF